MKKIAITTSSFGRGSAEPLNLLVQAGLEPVLNPFGRTLKAEEIAGVVGSAVGVVAGTEPITAEVLAGLPELKVISRCGTGLDNVDLEAAKNRGIAVLNTPDAPARAVAELTLAVLLDLLRKVSRMDRALRNGRWEKLMGNLLYQKKVGIVGFGRIGRRFAALMKPFECEVRYFDTFLGDGEEGLKRSDLPELLPWADIVSIHVSVHDMIIGAREIAMMRPEALLLNLCRGGVVDEDALFEALSASKLAGAALDVYKEEPYSGGLATLENVVLTPHVGSYAAESRVEMELEAAVNLIAGLKQQGVL